MSNKNYTRETAMRKIQRICQTKHKDGFLIVNGESIGIGTLGAVDYLINHADCPVMVLTPKKFERM